MKFWDEKHLLAISRAINKLYKNRTEYLVILGAPNDKDGLDVSDPSDVQARN